MGGAGEHVAGGAQQVVSDDGGAAADATLGEGGGQALAGALHDELADA